jgi:sugar lactone lactonase YvrE
MRRLLSTVISCVLLSGCFGPSEGVEVPQDQIYFPVGLALDSDASHLYVVSSDFDLQYNGGAVQSYRLDDLESRIRDLAGGCEEKSASERLIAPGRCKPLTPRDYQDDTVKIGAFATDAVLRERTSGVQRLFVPVRGDSTLHWIDVDGGRMSCGQENNDGACDAKHRAGDDPKENSRRIKLNSEPFAIAASAHGQNIVVTNQTTGTASLFVDAPIDDPATDRIGPKLKFALSSDRIPARPVGLAVLPPPLSDPKEDDTFLMTFRNSAQVRLFRYTPDENSTPERSYLVDGGGVPIEANSVGSDSRGVAVDTSARDAAESRCAAGDESCLEQAALVPLDVYVANRSPSSLLVGRTRPPQQYPYFYQSLPLTAGPSRVVVGKVRNRAGEDETRVFVVSFDSRRIFVYDPQRARMETEILTGRGPYALAVDTKRQLLYVGHFTDSYIGVYSLDLTDPKTYGTSLATLGTPKAPRSSK